MIAGRVLISEQFRSSGKICTVDLSHPLHDLLAFPSGLLRCTSQQHTHVFPLATLVVTCSILKKHITTLKLTYLTVKRMFHQSNRALVRFFRADDALEIFKLHYFMS